MYRERQRQGWTAKPQLAGSDKHLLNDNIFWRLRNGWNVEDWWRIMTKNMIYKSLKVKKQRQKCKLQIFPDSSWWKGWKTHQNLRWKTVAFEKTICSLSSLLFVLLVCLPVMLPNATLSRLDSKKSGPCPKPTRCETPSHQAVESHYTIL